MAQARYKSLFYADRKKSENIASGGPLHTLDNLQIVRHEFADRPRVGLPVITHKVV